MNYLLDTNVLSEVMRQRPDPNVLDWFVELDRIILCSITIEEITYGLGRKGFTEKQAWFRQFCEDKVMVLDINDHVARWSGEKRAELAGTGITVTMADSLIAAAAAVSGLILATRNTKDFEHMGIALFNPFHA